LKTVNFIVPGIPVGYSRSSARLMFTPAEVTRFRALVADCYQAAVSKLPEIYRGGYLGRVGIHMRQYGGRHDADNGSKEVLDGLKGGPFKDDRQVCRLIIEFPTRELGKAGGVKKPKDSEPRTEVWIQFLDGATKAA
jgi:hypothetical protein